MSTSDSPLDTIKDAEASLAKLTMEDKLSHPPPDLVELCSLNIKRLKISDMNVLSEEMTTSDKDQQQVSSSSKDSVLHLSKKYKARSFRVNDPRRQLKRMQKISQLGKFRRKSLDLERKMSILERKKDFELYLRDHEINSLKQKLHLLTEKCRVLAKLYEPDNNILKERIILEPKSIIANLKRKRAKAVLRPVFTNKNISTNVPT